MKNIENYLYYEDYIFNKALISQLSPELKQSPSQTGGGSTTGYNKG